MAMGDGILLASAGVLVGMLIVSFLARGWGGVGAAAIAFPVAYVSFFLLYVLVAFSNMSPFSRTPGATRTLYGPWIAVAVPVLPAVICALVLVGWIGNPAAFSRFSAKAATYLRVAGVMVAAGAVGYIAGSLLDWPPVDDTVSLALFAMLIALAIVLGVADRSALTGGALLVIALPLWFAGVTLARWSLIFAGLAMQLWARVRLRA